MLVKTTWVHSVLLLMANEGERCVQKIYLSNTEEGSSFNIRILHSLYKRVN